MKMTDILKKYVLPNLPYLIFLWFFAKVGEAVRLAPGVDASTKLLGLADGFTLAFQTSMPGAAVDWLIGLIGAAVVRLVVYVKGKNAKKYRKDVEYGSARCRAFPVVPPAGHPHGTVAANPPKGKPPHFPPAPLAGYPRLFVFAAGCGGLWPTNPPKSQENPLPAANQNPAPGR